MITFTSGKPFTARKFPLLTSSQIVDSHLLQEPTRFIIVVKMPYPNHSQVTKIVVRVNPISVCLTLFAIIVVWRVKLVVLNPLIGAEKADIDGRVCTSVIDTTGFDDNFISSW